MADITAEQDAANTLTAYCEHGGNLGDDCCYVCHAQVVLRRAAERIAALERERDGLAHGDRLMQADLKRFVTDCSTPTFQLVRNAMDALKSVEQRWRDLRERIEKMPGRYSTDDRHTCPLVHRSSVLALLSAPEGEKG